ncbi:MAG: replication initiator protein A [Roseburia inulinivorans]
MTDFLTADTNLPSYMMFPRFLLDMEINETAKMLYIILLDRARLSQKNEGWSDINGHVFIYFTIEALAEVLHKSQMTVKTALAVLEKQELIFRKRQGPGQPNRIYVKLPKETIHYTEFLDTRIQIRPDFRDKLIEHLKETFGKYYDYHHRDIAANEVDYLNVEDPDIFSHCAWELEYQRKQEIRRNQPARTKKKSYDIEL